MREKFLGIFIYVLILVTINLISCKESKPSEPEVNHQPIDTSDINLSFSKALNIPSQDGAKFVDISFGDTSFGALIYENTNRLYMTSDNGNIWRQSQWTPPYGFPLKCIAIKKDGSEIFIGTTSGGSSYPGRYAILNVFADTLIYTGNVDLYNIGNPNYDFIQAYYNYEGALWTAMGNSLKDDGNLLIKHSNTYSIWEDIDPLLGRRNYVSAIVRKRKGENIVGMFDYNGFQKGIFIKYTNSDEYVLLDINTSTPYQTEYPMSLSLNSEEKLLAAYGGSVNNNRLYVSTSSLGLWRRIIHTGIIGNFRSAKFDSKDYIWVCTDNGLYKSDQPVK